MSRCRGCRAEIEWATVADSGKKIPLNPGIDFAGNVYDVPAPPELDGTRVVKVATPEIAQQRRMQEATLYMPHHATCPAVEEFRKGRDDA